MEEDLLLQAPDDPYFKTPAISPPTMTGDFYNSIDTPMMFDVQNMEPPATSTPANTLILTVQNDATPNDQVSACSVVLNPTPSAKATSRVVSYICSVPECKGKTFSTKGNLQRHWANNHVASRSVVKCCIRDCEWSGGEHEFKDHMMIFHKYSFRDEESAEAYCTKFMEVNENFVNPGSSPVRPASRAAPCTPTPA